MRKPYSEFLDQLRAQLLGPLGKLPLEVRRDILERRIVDSVLNGFVVRVRANATSVTQAHIDELKASGLDEDGIFDACSSIARSSSASPFKGDFTTPCAGIRTGRSVNAS